jgi:hypothetical protein
VHVRRACVLSSVRAAHVVSSSLPALPRVRDHVASPAAVGGRPEERAAGRRRDDERLIVFNESYWPEQHPPSRPHAIACPAHPPFHSPGNLSPAASSATSQPTTALSLADRTKQ